MPHLVLEYADSVAHLFVARDFFITLHRTLSQFESFSLSDIKSRAYNIPQEAVCVGDGDPKRAFAALKLSVMSGRDVSVRQRVAQALMRHLEETFSQSTEPAGCQLSVEIYEIDKSTYVKSQGQGAPTAGSS